MYVNTAIFKIVVCAYFGAYLGVGILVLAKLLDD